MQNSQNLLIEKRENNMSVLLYRKFSDIKYNFCYLSQLHTFVCMN